MTESLQSGMPTKKRGKKLFRRRQWVRTIVVGLLGIGFLGWGAYFWLDAEDRVLNYKDLRAQGHTFASLSHGQVHYALEGDGNNPLVVLVHGFSLPSYVWDATAQGLVAQGYQVLRFDLYGRGFSERPDLDFSIDLFVAQLSELTRLIVPGKRFHLVGLSMGGPVSARFSHQHPERVRSLSLLAPLVETPERFDIELITTPLLGDYLSVVVMMPRLKYGLSRTVHDPASYPQWHAQLDSHRHYRGYRRSLLSTLRHLKGRHFEADYRRALEQVPVQLIWGREDQVVPYGDHARIAAHAQNIPLTVLDKTGHLPQIEAPERVNEALARFFVLH